MDYSITLPSFLCRVGRKRYGGDQVATLSALDKRTHYATYLTFDEAEYLRLFSEWEEKSLSEYIAGVLRKHIEEHYPVFRAEYKAKQAARG
jgi:hypothetical protein